MFLSANILFYVGLVFELSEGLLMTEVASQFSGYFSEVVLLLLARKFGTPIHTKSTYLQSGDCLIEGLDDQGN